jgi:ribonucleoside-diphosphate reductase alpha chain
MSRKGLTIEPIFCKGGDPYADIEWNKRTIETKEEDRVVKLEVEAPKDWSDNAVSTMATKYFRGVIGTPTRECSSKQLFNRVMDEMVRQGIARGFFDKDNGRNFGNDMKWLLTRRKYSFNSPVYFNVGAEKDPQGAACFILVIQDDLRSISEAQRVMIVIFSNGSGSGFNLSALREAGASLSRGGVASGPNTFLRGYNAWGGIIKSGGVQRRAAMLARLDDRHPDVYNGSDGGDFISLKAKEEKKARALVKKGFTVEEAYATVACQNANFSVGLSDAFMRAALEGKDWPLKSVVGGRVIRTVKASEMLDAIAKNALYCGDPGAQFDDTMNRWNPLIKIARILCTNPCVEFCCIVNTACNLASLNLASFYDHATGFNDAEFEAAVRLSIIAQDILVDMCGYPTEEITKNSRAYRPLGLGFSNLGGLFMKMGIPYDSDAARTWASLITSRMTATAYLASSELAKVVGPFTGFEENKKGVLSVLKQHRTKFAGVMDQFGTLVPGLDKVEDLWEKAYTAAAKHGVRNCQVTLVPPAGTISHMMDCATTGIEPLLYLIAKKKLVGGGEMILLNPALGEMFLGLGYTPQERDILIEYIKENGNLDGSPIKPQHLPIFDPVYPLKLEDRHISIQGQMLMLAAVQPFISGAISKTFGLPRNATSQEVRDIIIQAWKLGLKAVSVYRDGSKMSQPVVNAIAENGLLEDDEPARDRLPNDTDAKKHRVVIGGSKMYILPSFYPDGRIGEVFINGLGKDGSTLKGLVEGLMTSVSIGLQYGIPLEVFTEKFVGTIFSPRGLTSNPKIPSCTSLIDYIFRFLDMNYGEGIYAKLDDKSRDGEDKAEIPVKDIHKVIRKIRASSGEVSTGETCDRCGSLAVRLGPCKYCQNLSCPESKNGICG